jgi:hypothetical protein
MALPRIDPRYKGKVPTTERLIEAVSVPPGPLAVIVTAVVSSLVGVPEISPVEVLIERPCGKPVAVHEVTGRFRASSVSERLRKRYADFASKTLPHSDDRWPRRDQDRRCSYRACAARPCGRERDRRGPAILRRPRDRACARINCQARRQPCCAPARHRPIPKVSERKCLGKIDVSPLSRSGDGAS